MFCSKTEAFILSPLSELLSEAAIAMEAVENGMKGYQVADWLMPTIFLRMTGAQEQKLKCINWDLGSLDFELRYHLYSNKMGEMSCYDEKYKLCCELLSSIIRNNQGFDPAIDINRKKLLDDANACIVTICGNSVMKDWYAADYKDFEEKTATFKTQELVVWSTDKQKCTALFSGGLLSAFGALYNHRNKCAHNTMSYQRNLPKFELLSGQNAVFENYFIRFYVLILLDILFVQLYKLAVSYAELD